MCLCVCVSLSFCLLVSLPVCLSVFLRLARAIVLLVFLLHTVKLFWPSVGFPMLYVCVRTEFVDVPWVSFTHKRRVVKCVLFMTVFDCPEMNLCG